VVVVEGIVVVMELVGVNEEVVVSKLVVVELEEDGGIIRELVEVNGVVVVEVVESTVEVILVVKSASHPASLAIIHQKALPFKLQLSGLEWAHSHVVHKSSPGWAAHHSSAQFPPA